MKKIKLMQITHDLAIGGLQQVVVNLCRTIDRERFDVSVLCLRDLGEFVQDVENMGVKVIYLPQKKDGTDYFSFLKVARILKEENIDVIHTHNTQPFIDGTIAAILAGVKTIVHTDHARNFPDKKRYMFAEWLVSHAAYKVVGVSEHTSSNLMKYEKISKKKISTIPNGIDGKRYDIAVDKKKKRAELGIPGDGFVIGVAARLTEGKGISYLLQAMITLTIEFPGISLVIAGTGEYEEELKRQAKELEVADSTFFIGPRSDMPEILKVLDLFVLPSLHEGLPMVLLEAMAAGCPVVSTDVGGIFMAITNGENGSLVDSENSQALAMEISKVLKDKELRECYIRKGYERFRAEFSAETMTEQYQKLYLREM